MKNVRIFVIIGIAIIVCGGAYFGYKHLRAEINAKINYRYTLEDMYYNHYTSDEVFDVSIPHIRKENGKEDIYELEFQATLKQKNTLANSVFDISTSLPQSEYEKMIGNGNNSVNSQVYVLELAVPAKYKGLYSNYYDVGVKS